jgi:CRP/FNR family transcriptional regulator, cyclic AMP receptor protein
MPEPEIGAVLRQTALFRDLTDDELEEIVAVGRVVNARAGATLIRQEDEAGGMSVVLSGAVRIELALPDGTRQRLALMSPGDVFGELSLLDRAPRSASAVAERDAQVFTVSAADFDHLRRQFRPAVLKLLRAVGPVLCARLRAVNRAIAARMMERKAREESAAVEEAGGGRFDPASVPSLLGTPLPPPLPGEE